MKKLLFALMVIGLSLPVLANDSKDEVIIYTFTEKATEYTCDVNHAWQKSAGTRTGFMFMEGNYTSSLAILRLNTWKEKGADGKMHNYVQPEFQMKSLMSPATVGNKRTWLINSDTDSWHLQLRGDEKPVKMAGFVVDYATALAGTRTWYYTDASSVTHIGSSTISLKFNTKFTTEYLTNSALLDNIDASNYISAYLRDNKGYIILPLPIE
jgi:hypothetical protein